ncbi:ABC transporter permease [Candidatus Bipolaricaulota bacterium]|nr:ABC transporter permease [Candidatus Bipolaricaulota bacterium]
MVANSSWRRVLFLSGPGLAFLGLFLLAPILMLFLASFKADGTWTFAAYLEAFGKSYFRTALLRTIRIGLTVTLVTALLGYPTAYLISKASPRRKAFLMSLSLFPLMTTAVVRTFGWFVILGRHGVVNQFLMAMGLISRPIQFLYTEGAIVVGLTHLFFPLMLLSLISALENIPPEVEEAAQSLGASPLRAFRRVVFPLSADGLVVGGTLVFTGCITAYTTPAILGGTRVLTLATLLQQRAMTLLDWETATVVAVVLLVVASILNLLLRRLRTREAR